MFFLFLPRAPARPRVNDSVRIFDLVRVCTITPSKIRLKISALVGHAEICDPHTKQHSTLNVIYINEELVLDQVVPFGPSKERVLQGDGYWPIPADLTQSTRTGCVRLDESGNSSKK